jgi:hypothetical protein
MILKANNKAKKEEVPKFKKESLIDLKERDY